MKMKLKLKNIIIIFLFTTLSCEEYFVPDTNAKSGALVVEAILTDQKEIFSVVLSRSINYKYKMYYIYERYAKVTLCSASGEKYALKPSYQGHYHYESIDSIEAKTGESYYLHILTNDGFEYQSDLETMMLANPVEGVKAIDSTLTNTTYDSWGYPLINEEKGISITASPAKPARTDIGFIYKWDLLANFYLKTVEGMLYREYYCWYKDSSKVISIYHHSLAEHIDSMLYDNAGFLGYERRLFPKEPDTTRYLGSIAKIYTSSFYFQVKQYTITKAGADFWESVRAQSEATGKLFDPIEENISTNIRCINHSSQPTYGFFNTAACSSKTILVKINEGKITKINMIDFFPKPDEKENYSLKYKTDIWF